MPGYVNVENIYSERFHRNPNIVRMLHNLPKPLNHDIGEGLDTARNELRKVGLVEPVLEERGNSFVVTIKHELIASIEHAVISYLEDNPEAEITNKIARKLSGENDINKVKKSLQKLSREGRILFVDEKAAPFNYRYRRNW